MPRPWIAGILIAAALAVGIGTTLSDPPGGVPKELAIGLDPSPPFQYWDAQGRARGAMPELLEVAAERAGIRLRWVPFDGSPERALRPETGISLWPLLEVRGSRRDQFHITQPFARSESLLVRLEASSRIPVQRLGVGVRPQAREWGRKHYPHARQERPEDSFGLQELCAGTLDAVLVETPAFDALLMNRPPACAGARFRVRVIPELNTDYAMGATFAAADAADRLRHHLGEMAREGLLDEIFQAYYPLSHYRSPETFAETETERTRRLLRWGALGLAALCAALWMGLQRSRRNAHAAMAMAEMRSQFLASISHELRTPLNGVLGLASALDATSLDRTQREYVSLIRSSGEILLRTVNEVLDFSRLEAGKQVAAQEPVPLQRLVESVVSVLAPVAQQKGLELQWAVDRDLPRTVLSDETALRQILMNLVGNAIKFTAQGCVALQVRLENMEHTSALLRIAVSDSGPGIPAGQEESVFDPFVRGTDLRTQAIVGTGLGLSITKRLVLLMGGSIQVRNNPVQNNPEAGCTFEVLLPLAETDAAPAIQPACPPERTLSGHALLAARQPLALEMLSQQLRAAGAHLGEVSEEEALRTALDTEKHWDLIVLDDSLTPNLFSLAADLRGHPAAATALIVCMTKEDRSKPAASESASPDLALPPGIGFYRKPFLPELFCSFVENLQQSFCSHAGRNLAAAVATPHPGAAPEKETPRETKGRLASGQFAVASAHAPGAPEATAAWKLPLKSCPKDTEECALCTRQRTGGVVDCLAEFAPAGLSPLALVVDDNPVNRKVLVSLLRNLGVGCDTAASGEEALRFFAAQSYSWVLMDWHMPGMDGLDAIQRMRERESVEERRRTPVVLCTASSGNDPGLSKGKEMLDAVLPKPITLHSLCHALRASAGRCPSPASPPSRMQPEPTAILPIS